MAKISAQVSCFCVIIESSPLVDLVESVAVCAGGYRGQHLSIKNE